MQFQCKIIQIEFGSLRTIYHLAPLLFVLSESLVEQQRRQRRNEIVEIKFCCSLPPIGGETVQFIALDDRIKNSQPLDCNFLFHAFALKMRHSNALRQTQIKVRELCRFLSILDRFHFNLHWRLSIVHVRDFDILLSDRLFRLT
jgi:hypothetical protein